MGTKKLGRRKALKPKPWECVPHSSGDPEEKKSPGHRRSCDLERNDRSQAFGPSEKKKKGHLSEGGLGSERGGETIRRVNQSDGGVWGANPPPPMVPLTRG